MAFQTHVSLSFFYKGVSEFSNNKIIKKQHALQDLYKYLHRL